MDKIQTRFLKEELDRGFVPISEDIARELFGYDVGFIIGFNSEDDSAVISREEDLGNHAYYAIERSGSKDGIFNRIIVPCPRCGEDMEFRTKSGTCLLDTYYITDVPFKELEGILGKSKECLFCDNEVEIVDENQKITADNLMVCNNG